MTEVTSSTQDRTSQRLLAVSRLPGLRVTTSGGASCSAPGAAVGLSAWADLLVCSCVWLWLEMLRCRDPRPRLSCPVCFGGDQKSLLLTRTLKPSWGPGRNLKGQAGGPRAEARDMSVRPALLAALPWTPARCLLRQSPGPFMKRLVRARDCVSACVRLIPRHPVSACRLQCAAVPVSQPLPGRTHTRPALLQTSRCNLVAVRGTFEGLSSSRRAITWRGL